MSDLRVALAQINLLVGDVSGNTDKLIAAANDAKAKGAHVVVYPELAVTGYPPEDLLLRPALMEQVEAALHRLRREVAGITLVVGHPWREDARLFNAVSAIRDGQVLGRYYKQALPNYGVFDEMRYFTPGEGATVVEVEGVKLGLTICEDIWQSGPVEQSVAAGAELVLNINASPYHYSKRPERETVVAREASANKVPVVYVNLVGGQDELVFDGNSLVMDAEGKLAHRAPEFRESLTVVEFKREDGAVKPSASEIFPALAHEEGVYQAIVTGVRDYVEKAHFPGVVLGLSGGIDSALCLAVAVDALGADRVEAVMMPSRYTSDMSVQDAQKMADILGIQYHVIPIEPMFRAFTDSLAETFAGKPADTTEENIQARCRGIILMAISNKSGKMVLTTGNKSEMAVGYATLYGDMAGGFAAIKDVPKTLVFRLSEYRNTISRVIPQRIIDRPPSAELAPDQVDEDSLPPYEVLDPILEMFIEKDMSPKEIVARGYDEETVRRVTRMVLINEYKRRQAPPGVRITSRAFGRDRRYPIISGYRE